MPVIQVFDSDGNEYAMEVAEDEDGIGSVPDVQRTPAEWAKLRRSEKAARDAKAAQEQADRVLAFYRAGINPDDPRMSYFVKGYDGPLETTAITEAAVGAGFLAGEQNGNGGSQPPDPTALDLTTASHQANRAISQAGAGASPTQTNPVAAMVEANERAGRDGIIDQLRAAGIPVQFDGQE